MSKDMMSQQLQLPWWKRIVLDKEYRSRIMALTTERYRDEMFLMKNFPHQLASAIWDDGTPIPFSSQYICVDDNTVEWSRKHPKSVVEVSSFQTLKKAAAAMAIPGRNEKEKALHIREEMQPMYNSEKPEDRLYGLSYIWDRQLPPYGFIRMWPDPLSAMWPSMLDSSSWSSSSSSLSLGMPVDPLKAEKNVPGCTVDPTAVHVYRRNGEYLGTWRQSLFLIRYKVMCWAMHEEKRRRTSGVVDRCLPSLSRVHSETSSSHSPMEVPVFEIPLLRLQRGTVEFSKGTRRVNVCSLKSPTTWEGIAPSPSMYRASESYRNWHALHHNSAVVSQAVRDVYDMLPAKEAGLLTKVTYIEFFLDLLNLFFPTHVNALNIAIAEEEWVYRGTTELLSFETFYEKLFNFPFIFLRDISTVTREEYVEVWSLIRVCLLEDRDSVFETLKPTKRGNNVVEGGTSECHNVPWANTLSADSLAGTTFTQMAPSHGTATPETEMQLTQKVKQPKKNVPSLISGISGIPLHKIIEWGMADFHNTDNFPLYRAKQIVEKTAIKMLRQVLPSRWTAIIHTKAQRLLARDARMKRQQATKDEQSKQQLRMQEEILGTKSDDDDRSSSTKGSKNPASVSPLTSILESGLNDTMFRRRLELEQVEERQKLQRILNTSIWYKQRCQRLHGMYQRTLMWNSCTTSSWMLHKPDIYEVPSETLDDEDALIAFLQELPDEFFDDRVSLRLRYNVFKNRLSDRAEQLMHSETNASTSYLPLVVSLDTNSHSVASVTSNADGLLSSSLSMRTSGRASRDRGRKKSEKIAGVQSHFCDKTMFSSQRLKSTVRMGSQQPQDSVNSLPPISTTEGRSISLLASSAHQITDYDGSTSKTGSIPVGSPHSQKRVVVSPQRALQLRMQLKHDMDLRFAKGLQSRSNPPIPFMFLHNKIQKSTTTPRGGGGNVRFLPSF